MKTLHDRYAIYSTDDIARRHRGRWFEPEAMRFFRTRICASGSVFPNEGLGLFYFVTSEKGPDGVRRYSVRAYDPECDAIDTVGDFGGHKSARAATREARRLAGG